MSCPCGKPAPDGNLCPACGEQIRQNLTTIADRWSDLEQALTRRELHAGEQGKTKRSMVASGTSLNEASVRARRACTDVVWFILQVIRDDLDTAGRPFTPPRVDSRSQDATPRLARWIAAWQVPHITHRTSPETAEEILGDVARAERATFDALKEYARTVPTGLPCEHHGTSDLGERVPAPGLLEAPNERAVVRTQIQDPGVVAPLLKPIDRGDEVLEERATPDVAHNGYLADAAARQRGELDKLAEQCRRQVVDAEVAEILERVDGLGASRPGHPRDEHEIALVPALVIVDSGRLRRHETTYESLPSTSEVPTDVTIAMITAASTVCQKPVVVTPSTTHATM